VVRRREKKREGKLFRFQITKKEEGGKKTILFGRDEERERKGKKRSD